MGEPYSLFVVRDLYGEVVFYLGTSGEKYGLKEVIADKIEIEGDLNYNMLTKEEREAEVKRLLKK